MRNPLTSDERVYVLGLSQRLGGGHKPMLADWFRSLELVEKYNPKSKSKAKLRLSLPPIIEIDATRKRRKR